MAEEIKRSGEVEKWLGLIAEYDRVFSKWETRGTKIVKRYRDEHAANSNSASRYPILWTNIQTLIPACYAKTPKPEVMRRFADKDDCGRVASLILQRALEFELEHYSDFSSTMSQCILDRFLPGRGTAWVRYEPEFGDGPELSDVEEGVEEEETTPEQILLDEKTPIDYVHWQDFGHVVARTWEEVPAVWRMVYMDRDALVERFGEEVGKTIPLDSNPNDQLKKSSESSSKKALIYEIWHKDGNEVLWLSKSHPEILDKRTPGEGDTPDIEGFFPCPKPMYATITPDSLVPVPDFAQYQYQAKQLDTIADRIDGLVKALKVAGVYDASVSELQRLLTEGTNNTLIPVKNWGALSEKGGLKGAIDLVPLDVLATTLQQLYVAQKACKDEIAYILGLADIVHGVGEAGETATAQGIKGNYVGLRLNCAQGQVAQFASDLIRIKAQHVAMYDPQTLIRLAAVDQMSQEDQQLVPQALELLQNKVLRNFRIEVAADSMVNIDEAQEKADRTEFITAFSSLMRDATPLLLEEPAAAPMVLEIIKFGIGAYKGARTIEGVINKNLDAISKTEQQAMGQQKPDKDMQKLQAQTQAEQQSKQMEFQFEQEKLQLEDQANQRKEALQAQQVAHQNQLEAQRDAMQAQNEAALKRMELEHAMALAQQQQQFDKWKAELDAATRIQVAQIAAQAGIDQATLAASQRKVTEDMTE